MSGPFGSSQWMYASGGFYPYQIEQSLRFNDDDSAYLSRTPASAGNRKTWTWSGWVKRGNFSTKGLFSTINSGTSNTTVGFNGDALDFLEFQGSTVGRLVTTPVFRDPSAWYHIIAVWDSSNATSTDRIRLYVNGSRITALSTATYPTLNLDSIWNNNVSSSIGTYNNGSPPQLYLDGYMAEVNFIDGTALDPTSFGETKSGIWVPKAYDGSYGTNGFYLSFADSAAIGDDLSGNGNDWTANNLVSTDVLLDSPTENYCVLNAVDNYNTGATLSEGNLKWVIGAADGATRSTFVMDSGKWYAEFLPSDYCGVVGIEDAVTDDVNGTPSVWYFSSGQKRVSGTVTSYGASYTEASDLIGLAVDLDAGEVTFYKNNVSQGAITLPASAGYAIAAGSGSGSKTSVLNFGQDSSFAGNETRQGNTDDNGVGDFYYAPPSGFLALCTANLPDPVIDPAQDDVPADYFNTVLYTGNGVFPRSITGVGFQPDLVYYKSRSASGAPAMYDAVRGAGAGKMLSTNQASAEGIDSPYTDTDYGFISSFDVDGFSLDDGAVNGAWVNNSGTTYVAWNWLAGNGTASNTSGSITSTVSVNQKAGFSVVGFTQLLASGSYGHGLGATPELMIRKRRDAATSWGVWHKDFTINEYLFLQTTDAKTTFTGAWETLPTDTLAYVRTPDGTDGGAFSGPNTDWIAYHFVSVEGYSKFGSYTGNGSTDGPFVYCGFRPAWVMVKNSSTTGNWRMYDTKRPDYNPEADTLYADLSNAEDNTSERIDILSNGFKLRNSATNNGSGVTVIFIAFAESPFKYANAR
jgi:hypothetical protein